MQNITTIKIIIIKYIFRQNVFTFIFLRRELFFSDLFSDLRDSIAYGASDQLLMRRKNRIDHK